MNTQIDLRHSTVSRVARAIHYNAVQYVQVVNCKENADGDPGQPTTKTTQFEISCPVPIPFIIFISGKL